MEHNAERERLFQQAFAAKDPAPFLLHVLKNHPTSFAIQDLVFSYFNAVRNDPYRAQDLASALARVINSTDAPSFGNYPLSAHLSRELAGAHFKLFEIDTKYGPKNSHLINSLLSGFSFKYKLCCSPDMDGFIGEGLKAPHGEESEVLVIGACIQLLIHGSGTDQGEPGEVSKKLKEQKMAETVKDPHALEVLEVLN